jgi:hypothetical protein
MSRVVYGTILNQERVAVVGSVKITQEGVFVSENGIIVPKTITKDLNESGYFSQELDTPISGTVLTMFELPTGHTYGLHLATGAATDLAELITSEGSAVAASDLQTLLQLEKIFKVTQVTAEYTVLATDAYLACTGSPTPIHLPACVYGTTGPLVVDNKSSVNITVARSGSATINGNLTLVLYPGDRRTFACIDDDEWSA